MSFRKCRPGPTTADGGEPYPHPYPHNEILFRLVRVAIGVRPGKNLVLGIAGGEAKDCGYTAAAG